MTDDVPRPDDDLDRATLRLDTRSLRALAHPLRVRLLGRLRASGSSTATLLAAELGLNSGATSYHLRTLAAAGLVEEDVERGTGRDRWWRPVHRTTTFDPTTLAPEDRPAGEVYLQAVTAVYAERMHQYARAVHEAPWDTAGTMSDWRLRLTAGEARSLTKELEDVVARYRRDDDPDDAGPPDAEVVATQLQVMVQPGERDRRLVRPTSGSDEADR